MRNALVFVVVVILVLNCVKTIAVVRILAPRYSHAVILVRENAWKTALLSVGSLALKNLRVVIHVKSFASRIVIQ
jgi:hypothetical protein